MRQNSCAGTGEGEIEAVVCEKCDLKAHPEESFASNQLFQTASSSIKRLTVEENGGKWGISRGKGRSGSAVENDRNGDTLFTSPEVHRVKESPANDLIYAKNWSMHSSDSA